MQVLGGLAVAAVLLGCGDNGGRSDAMVSPAIDGGGGDGPSADATTTIDTAPPAPAVLRVNELNPKLQEDCDLVELRVIAGGTLAGAALRDGPTILVTFTDVVVPTNALLLVHLDREDAACNPGTSPDETTGPAQHPAATFAANADTAYDWYSPQVGLEDIGGLVHVVDAAGAFQDVIAYHDVSIVGVIPLATLTVADAAAADGQWPPDPQGNYDTQDFRDNAQDVVAAQPTQTGVSIQRNSDLDNNAAAGDWTDTATGTFGVLNANQNPF
jgi:hypothetical protein